MGSCWGSSPFCGIYFYCKRKLNSLIDLGRYWSHWCVTYPTLASKRFLSRLGHEEIIKFSYRPRRSFQNAIALPEDIQSQRDLRELLRPNARRQGVGVIRRVTVDPLQYIDEVVVRVHIVQPTADEEVLYNTGILSTDFNPSKHPLF